MGRKVLFMIINSSYQSPVDGTLKYQILTSDNHLIEACVIFFWEKPTPVNICISSQVGCECKCSFCVTGYKRFIRNLSTEEIREQVDAIFARNPDLLRYNFEITYMGTGEPMQNWDNVVSSAKLFSNQYLQLSRINISSIFPKVDSSLEKIFLIKTPIHFQFSMHFVTDELRRKYFRKELPTITSVLDALSQMYNGTGSLFCINYILFNTINDRLHDANALIQIIQSYPAYLKISKYCPIEYSELEPSNNYEYFTSVLNSAGIKWKAFESKGIDIHAACGHLLSDIHF